MSHTVRVDFEQIAMECDEVCDRVESRIGELQHQLDYLKEKATSDMDAQTRTFINAMESDIDAWLNIVADVRRVSQSNSRLGTWRGDSDDETFRRRYEQKDRIYDLKRLVNREVAERKPAVKAIIGQMMDKRIERINAQARKEPSFTDKSSEIKTFINGISDVTLRQFVYLAHVANPALGKDDLLAKGKSMYEETLERERQAELSAELKKQKEEMVNAKMPEEDISKALNINANGTTAEKLEQLSEQASNAMIREKKRKESLKIILKAVKAQGFNVNPQKDIVRQGDKVVMRAHKLGGEIAMFTINLDGKFIYDFKGYEGQACQNDIEPFLKDLAEVYGVDLVNRKEIWKNPDKIQTQKRQSINSNQDKA